MLFTSSYYIGISDDHLSQLPETITVLGLGNLLVLYLKLTSFLYN